MAWYFGFFVISGFCSLVYEVVWLRLAMAGLRSLFGERAKQSFSYLYVANVLGATAGTIGSALVLIELFGFRGTLLVAASLNGLLAASALALSFGLPANAPLAPGATA